MNPLLAMIPLLVQKIRRIAWQGICKVPGKEAHYGPHQVEECMRDILTLNECMRDILTHSECMGNILTLSGCMRPVMDVKICVNSQQTVHIARLTLLNIYACLVSPDLTNPCM